MENFKALLNSNTSFTSLRDLELGTRYTITRFEIVVTKYGPKLLVILDTNLRVILPDHIAKKFTENDVEEMNSNPVKLILIYKGLKQLSNGYSKHLIIFE